MTKWASLLAAAVLTAPPSSAALVVQELSLTTDAPYTGFGGGSAGDKFVGTFGFDDSLLSFEGSVFWDVRDSPSSPILSENAFFLNIDLNGTSFSTNTPGTDFDLSALQFAQGALLDVYFEFENPSGERLQVATDSARRETFWLATEDANGASAEGRTFEESVYFKIIPEPPSVALAALAALALLQRRR